MWRLDDLIRSVKISGLRGIRKGELHDLTPLTVLVGVNGSGKSTVLNALYMAGSPNVGMSTGHVAQRHWGTLNGTSWLLSNYPDCPPMSVMTISTSDGKQRTIEMNEVKNPGERDVISYHVMYPPTSAPPELEFSGNVTFERGGRFRTDGVAPSGLTDLTEIRMVELTRCEPEITLHDLYSGAVKYGRRSEVLRVMQSLVPGLSDLEILTDSNEPILHFVFEDRSVPAALAGDGITSLLRLTLELTTRKDGAVLVEEPEVHQHPAALRRCARVIWAAVRRNIQVVLTTHSLDLIDDLLSEASTGDIDKLSVFRLRLDDGTLQVARIDGKEVAFARTEIQDDLR